MATAGAIVIATAVGGMVLSNLGKDNQSELPASLRQEVANTSPATPPPPMPSNIVAPTVETLPPMQPPPTEVSGQPTTTPSVSAVTATDAAKALPNAKTSQVTAKAVPRPSVNGQVVTPLVATNPSAPNTAAKATKTSSVVGPATVNNGAPRIASAVQTQTKTAATNANSRPEYAQALARLQAGDAAGARQLLNRASELGDTRAQNRLAKMYERGEGVPRDMVQARRLTERAAQAGSRQAQHNLGVYFSEGAGAQQDFNRASENFRRAARRGLPDSQYNLGLLAEQGLGGPKSNRDAYYWYSLAARSGDTDAQRKSVELARSLAPNEKVAEDRRVTAFRAETGGPD